MRLMIAKLFGKQVKTFTEIDMQGAYESGINDVIDAMDEHAYQDTRIGFMADVG